MSLMNISHQQLNNPEPPQKMGCWDRFSTLAWQHLKCEDMKEDPETHTYRYCSLFSFLA